MIKKFNEFISYIEISIIEDFHFNINEEFNYNTYKVDNYSPILSIRGKSLILKEQDKKKLKEYEKKLIEYSKKEITSTYNNKIYKYKIIPTEHFVSKYVRKEYEDPNNKTNLENPELYEAVELLENNINLISKYLSEGIITVDSKILIESKKSYNYNFIIVIEKSYDLYKITLVSQMKGASYSIRSKKIKLG